MKGPCWWLAERVSGMLEADERDAVWGDLAESGESGTEALRGLLGLVARRQAAMWKDWRMWPVLGGLVPLAWLLARQSGYVAHLSAIYLWMYVDNWRTADMGNSGFWLLMAQVGAPILASGFMLMVWSWAGGVAIGVLGPRTNLVNGVLFCGTVALADISLAPGGSFGANGAVFTVKFYRTIYPLMVQCAVVMLPLLWGMILGRRLSGLRRG